MGRITRTAWPTLTQPLTIYFHAQDGRGSRIFLEGLATMVMQLVGERSSMASLQGVIIGLAQPSQQFVIDLAEIGNFDAMGEHRIKASGGLKTTLRQLAF